MTAKTIVLVQGAWGSSASWTPVAERLRGLGHRVHVPSLTGLGERRHLFGGSVNLSTHIDDVANAIEAEGLDRFVLVAHSYGGMVATAIADRYAARIEALVYLDAFVPQDGQSAMDLLGPDAALANLAAAGLHGGIGVPPPERHAARVPAELRFHMQARSPQPLGTMVEKVRLTGAQDSVARRLYVSAEIDQAPVFARIAAALRDDSRWAVTPIQTGHMLQLELPADVTALIDQFIQGLRPDS